MLESIAPLQGGIRALERVVGSRKGRDGEREGRGKEGRSGRREVLGLHLYPC